MENNSIEKATHFLENDFETFEDVEDAFEDIYYDFGSFGSTYSIDNKIIKVHYTDLSFVNESIQKEISLEGLKLKELQSIDLFPKLHSFTDKYIIMEKIEGRPLWGLTNDEILNIEMFHWYNLIEELNKVIELGYRPIDISSNNIFWTDNGFRLIDVGLYVKDYPKELHKPKVFSEYNCYSKIYDELKKKYSFDETYIENIE